MSYIKSVSTLELGELKLNSIARIKNASKRIDNKEFNEYFPSEKVCQESINFETKEIAVIDNELKNRKVEKLTVVIDSNSKEYVRFYENLGFWESWILDFVDSDFGIMFNNSIKLNEFKELFEKYGYKFKDGFYQNVNEKDLVEEIVKNFHFRTNR